jgi:hypothetical protein
MEVDLDPEPNVNVLRTTSVVSFLGFTFSRAFAWVGEKHGDGRMYFADNVASRNFNTTLI